MCDCFHLAFPNWHAPAAGAGRRLRGPEQEAEDNSVCEDPEIVERERPRPQGSSPVEEFPIEKQAEEDLSGFAHKSGSNKKGRKGGFGSLFDKRTADKMIDTEEMQSGESEIIVKTVKEACVEGLVMTGGGKEGIFIKEVKVDSPASKHLSVKEGDQILSATVYFDNVSYEDALQILEHAQPYKMEFCLRRKVEPTIPENPEIKYPKEKDQGPPTMRNQRKMKKQQERISWPKFPSFGKGPRVQFKRSHSTSEAEEHRKLEMSPPTSDTESPLKSPLKGPDGKDKKKKHKVQLKMKMKGHRSKSVEEPQSSENLLVWENQQVEGILEEKIPEGHEEKMQEILQVLDGAENEVSFKTGNDEPFQSFSGMEMHEAHLISLGNTLKTTDISVALAEKAKTDNSEMKVEIYQKEKPDSGTENQTESTKALHTILDLSACDNVVLSQTEVEIGKVDNEASKQGLGKDGSEQKVEFGNAELSMPNLDICVGVTKTSPRIGSERQLKDKSVFENESYGIRTRGPLADMATSKSHFVSTVNGLQFMSSDYSEIMQVGKMSEGISDTKNPNVIFHPKSGSTVFAVEKEDSPLVKTSKLPTEASASEFKLPKVDLSGLVTHELISMTEVEKNRMNLPKREDIKIPGMENKETKPILKIPKIKVPKIEKVINITKDPGNGEEFNVEDVKVAVSKFPAFKLPEGDITGVLVQREIELKSTLSPRGSPHKISITSTDSTIIPISKVEEDAASDTADKNTVILMPKVEPPYIDEQTSTAVKKIDYTQSQLTDYERFGDLNFKLPKREDIEIPGMEAIKEAKLQNTADLDQTEKPRTKKHGDKKGHEKKPKKPKINIQPDTPSWDIGSDLPKMDSSNINTEETKILEKQKFKTPNIEKVKNIEVQIEETKILEDNMDLPQKSETKFGKTKFKIPSVTLPEFGTKVPREEANISAVDVHGKKAEQKLPEDKMKLSDKTLLSELNGTDINKDSQPVNMYYRAQDPETEGQGRKFKLPKFEISFPEVKPPRISCTSKKDDDSSLSEESGKMPVVRSPEAELPAVKPADLPDVHSQITEMKIKRPGFSLPRFGLSKTESIAPAADVTLSNVDKSVPEGQTKMDDPNTNIAISVKDCKDKDATKFSSPTKFKIPSIRFPHFGVKVTKTTMETSDVDVNVKGPEISLPHTELPKEPMSIDIKVPDTEQKESIGMNIQSEAQGSKFKLPKLGVRLPEVKGPKLNINTDKAEIDIYKPEVNPPDIEVQGVTPKVNVDVAGHEITLPDADMKISTEPLSVGIKLPDADKGMESLSVKMKDQDIQMKEKGSKFKLPKSQISLPEVKGPKVDVSLNKGDIDFSVPKAKVKIHPSNFEGQGVTSKIKVNLPEEDSKDVETKNIQGCLLPEIEFRKSEINLDGAITLPNVDVSLTEGSIEIERTCTDVALSMGDAQQKSRSKFGSPTKFKLPSVNFPKFGTKGPKASVDVSDVAVGVKGPEITLSDAEVKLSAEPQPVDIKGSDVDNEMKSSTVRMTDQDVQMKEKGSKFKLPKFGISLPEVKGPKLNVNLEKVESDSEKVEGVTAEIKADLPEVDSIEMKMKSPGFSFPKIGLGKSEVKASEGDVSLPYVDVSLPEGSLEIERPATDVTLPMDNAEQKVWSKFGSPTKFKLPSVSFPKFGTKGPKASVEFPDMDVDIKGPEIALPDTQIKWSAEPLSVDIKGPGLDKEMKPLCVEMNDQDIKMEEQESKFKLSEFGISLPEVKGPEIDVRLDKAEIDMSMPKVKVHLPEAELQDVTAELKADLPDIDSKDIELKIKTLGVSSPKIEFCESEVKAFKGDVSISNGNVSLAEESIALERPSADITISLENAEQKDPTKFKLPSISFPKFGTKGPKLSVKVSDVDVDVKGPEITLLDTEMNLSAEPLSLDIKGPGAEKEMKPFSVEIKDQNIQMKEQGSKFKLPKFGISLPDVKGPKIDRSSDKAEIDISIPEANLEMAPPNVKVQGVTAEIKAGLPEVNSKDFEMNMETPGSSFPKIDFSKSGVKAPEGDVSLPNVDMSLPKGSIEIEIPSTDVSLPIEDAEQKSQSKFGSPTKFKLPSISFPKFATKGPKASVEVSDMDIDAKRPEITLTDAEIKLSAKPISMDIKGPDVDKEIKPPSVEKKDQDIQIKEKGSKFKFPKFGISLPEFKGPKDDVSLDKVNSDIVVPKAKLEVHPPDAEMQGVTAKIKADLPEVDSKDIELKMKTQDFSFPKIGFSKSDDKAAKVDVSPLNVNVPLHEESIEIERPSTDVTIPMEIAEQKGQSKFGSPTKFKLPSVSFPKFGTKGPKASVEFSDMDVDIKGPEIVLPDAEMKLSAEPFLVDIKGSGAEKEIEPLCMEIKDLHIQIKEQVTEPKLPKFGISLPEDKGPKIDVSSDKAEIDIFLPKAKIHPPDAEVQGIAAKLKADLPEDIELKMKTPGFSFPKIGFSKSEVKAPKGDMSLANVDMSLPERSIEMETLSSNVTISLEDTEQKDLTKFTLPSVSFPKFGTKGLKAPAAVSDVDVDVKEPTITLPDVERNVSAEPFSVDIKGPCEDKEMKPFKVEIKEQNIQLEDQESELKWPNFGINLPGVKGPKIDISSDKPEIEISIPEANLEMAPPNVHGVTVEIKPDVPEIDSKDHELKMETPGFSFPKIDFSKADVKAPEGDVCLLNIDMSLPKGSIEIEKPSTDVSIPMQDAEQKSRLKFGSPTKFKLPSINLPKFGTKGRKVSVDASDVDVDAKGPKITLPDAELKLSAKPLSVDIKGPDVDKEMKPPNVKIIDQDIQIKEKGSKFKLPKFEIGLPEVKGSKVDASLDKVDSNISVPKAQGHPPDAEVQKVTADKKASLPKVDSKGPEVKIKTPGFSFPKIGFSKSEVNAPKGGVSLPNVGVSLPEESIDMERPSADVTISLEDAEQKDPTRFKLPSINLQKFGTKSPKASVEVSDVDIDVKGPEITLPDTGIYLSAEPLSVDIKGPGAEKETKPFSVEIKDQNIQMKEQGSKFKLPKFGISLPDVKGPKIDRSSDKAEIDISIPEANLEMAPPNVKVQGVTAEIKAGLPEVNSKDFEMNMETPGSSFYKTEFSKSDVKAPEGDVSLPNVDMNLPERSIEIEKPSTDVSLTMENAEHKSRSKFSSPTKFKLPSVNFPKFGTKGPKASVEFSDVDVDAKGHEIILPDAEIKLSAEPISVDIKEPDVDKEIKLPNVEMKEEDVQIKDQWSKFRLPKFGISLPEMKGSKVDASLDKVDSDFSIPKAKVEVHPPDVEVQGVTAKIKADLPEVDSKDIELKIKKPGLSFPKIGFVKSEVKAPEVDVSFPKVDVSVSEESAKIEKPATDVTISDTEHKVRSKFGSPTKFKLPSINFPKFGTKGPKASVEVTDVDVDAKGPEITLPDTEIKLSAVPLSVDIKGPVVDKEIKPATVEIKDQDIQMKEQASKVMLPKFGISLSEVKGPKIDRSTNKAELDISVAKGKAEVHSTDVEVQGVTAKIKADLPEVDSKDIELKMKKPSLSFPKIGFVKSEVKAPEVDVSFPKVDVSVSEESAKIEKPATDVTISDTEHKVRSKFGSPTKFKLPSINFPKFGTKGPKASVEVTDVDVDAKGPEITLPDAEIKLSAEPLSVDIKGPDVEKETKPPSVEMKDHDIQIKEQGGKFKLPKFEISLPEIKAPRLDVRSDKAEIDISVPKANVEIGLPDAEMHRVTPKTKAELPEVNSKDTEVKMRTPGFSFPGIGFSKPEGKVPKGDVNHPNVNMSLPKGSIETEKAATDVTLPMEDAEQKDQSKFGSPTKFKLPSINFPKFGTKGPKASVDDSDVDVNVKEPQISLPDTELKLLVEPIKVDVKGSDAEKEIKPLIVEVKDQDIQMKEKGSTFKLPKFGFSLPEVKGPTLNASLDRAEIDISIPKTKIEVHDAEGVKPEIKADLPEVQSAGSDVKLKEPGLSFPKFSKSDSKANNEEVITGLDSQVKQCGDGDTAVNNNAFDVILEPKQKYTKEVKMSSKFLSAKLGDVFSGFDIEFNVPTFDEIEETKQKYLDTLKHEHKLNVIGQISTECISKPEDGEAQEKLKAGGQKQTTKDNVTVHFDKKAEDSPPPDINKNESKKCFTGDINEDNISPTLSLSSSDAFADESSAPTSEQIGLSLASPTVVKVKYFEPTANAEVSEVYGDIITSTARSELISMDPHQPEKVNIPFSSEASSSSVDTLMSGHIVVSNVQSVSKTEHAAILTRVDALPSEKAIDSMSVKETVIRKGHTIVEKHVIKKIFSDDKEKISVTQKIQVFEGDSSEPISVDTASSIQKLRDTVHSEKLKFFEGAESSKTVVMSTETLLRHADSSTDENEGK